MLVKQAKSGQKIEIVYPHNRCFYTGGIYTVTSYQDIASKVRALDVYGHPKHLHPLNHCRLVIGSDGICPDKAPLRGM